MNKTKKIIEDEIKRRLNNEIIEKVKHNNDKKLSDLDNTKINTGKNKGKSFKWIYENDTQYINWIEKQTHLKNPQLLN